ncbi:MAG: methylated-DNA--[protein]-cysteine S-methyltransferase [Phycisphaeraceae bacterium]|nr:MAG: methylated-DNA--[protein]-cysteine S-methyltransferase [Phycisphaeraceae bacterium]
MSPGNEKVARRCLETPLGALVLTASEDGLRSVCFEDTVEETSAKDEESAGIVDAAAMQLIEYFAGKRTHFDIPLNPPGTPFQQRVWELLRTIPFGETRSYAWLADRLALPGGSRAVGAANRANPIAIVIPCHRVIRSDGDLCGYAGGIRRKKWLLEHEGAQQPTLFTPADASDADGHHSGPPVYRP